MPKPRFREKARTPFAERVRQAMSHADLDLPGTGAALSRVVQRRIKPQTVQWLASVASSSALTADLAEVLGVRYAWLARGDGRMVGAGGSRGLEASAVLELISVVERELAAAGRRVKPGGWSRLLAPLLEVWAEDGRQPSRAVVAAVLKAA